MREQKNFFIMPFKIIASGNGALEESRYFAKDGTPFYSMIKPTKESLPENDVELNYELFCKLISIRDAKEAAEFFEDYPKIRFAYYEENNKFLFPVSEYEPIHSYYKTMTEAISLYNKIREFMNLENEYRKTPSIEKRDQVINGFRDLFSSVGCLGNSHPSLRSFHELFIYEYGDLMDSMCRSADVVALANEQGYHAVEDALRHDAISYRDIIIEYFFGDDDKAREQLAYLEEVNDRVYGHAIRDVSYYCSLITQRIDMSFAPDLMMFVCRCPDLLSAMYLMTYVSLHNEDEYAICQHKNCHQYYLVDKRYPQSRCDKHMQSRRTKRANQREKLKNYEY